MLAGIGSEGVDVVPIGRQPPREQSQAANAEAQIMIAEEINRLFARPAAHRRYAIQPDCGEMGGQMIGNRLWPGQHQFGRAGVDQISQRIDNPGEFDLRITVIGIAGLFCRRLLGLASPAGEPANRRPVKKQRPAEQLADRFLHLWPQGVDNHPQPGQMARMAGDLIEVVPHRLFARDGGKRAEDHREKPRRAGIVTRHAANFVRPGVDIDKAPIHLTLGRAIAQHVHGLGKWRVDQHRTVDQRYPVGFAAPGVFGHHPGDKRLAPGPRDPAFRCKPIDLAQLQGGKSARKAGRGAGGEDQFQRRGERTA